jgi:O-antigen/teichoic acid export membrane protein
MGMISLPRRIHSLRVFLRSLSEISLYRNSIYLIANNLAVQATGFFFWVVASRLYSADAVGLGSAATSAMMLLALVSTLGLDMSLIRFLPTAGEEAVDMINTCLTICVLGALVLAVIFIAGMRFWSPALMQVQESPFLSVLFVTAVAATGVNIIFQRVFVARRRAGLALTRGLVFAFSRLGLLAIAPFFIKSFGILVAWTVAVFLSVIVSVISVPKVEAAYRPSFIVKKKLVKEMARFSVTNFATNLLQTAPVQVLPLIVVNLQGATQNAYFYIGWSLGSLLFVAASSLSVSLFAEGSLEPTALRRDVARSFKFILCAVAPAALLMLLLGGRLLLLFGRDYSANSSHLVQLMSLSALPMSVNQVYFSVKRIKMQMNVVIVANLLIAILALGLSYAFIPYIGVDAVGIAWLVSQMGVAVWGLLRLWK